MKMSAIWSKERCLVRRKKVLLVVFPVVVLFFGRKGVPGAWCLVKNIEGLGEDLWCLEKEAPNEEGVGSFLGTPRQEVYTWEKV